MAEPLLAIHDLLVSFDDAAAPAVDGIDLVLAPGSILALVGESGSGKSMTALAVIGLLPAAARMQGTVVLAGRDISALERDALEDVRGAEIGMIFQEPMTSLNPVLNICRQMTEGLLRHRRLSRAAANAAAIAALAEVDIPEPERLMRPIPISFPAASASA